MYPCRTQKVLAGADYSETPGKVFGMTIVCPPTVNAVVNIYLGSKIAANQVEHLVVVGHASLETVSRVDYGWPKGTTESQPVIVEVIGAGAYAYVDHA